MGAFDGSIYRIRAYWSAERDPEFGEYTATLYTDNPAGYFAGLEKTDDQPDRATVHELHYTVRDTDFSYGEYVEDE
jgi:hypothetical protein